MRQRLGRWLAAIIGFAGIALYFGGSPTATYAAFPGTNGLIAWARGITYTDVISVDPNNPSSRKLVAGGEPEVDDEDPAWSPDGQKLAFISDRDGGARNLYVVNPDGSDVVKLTDNSDPASLIAHPAWSPDGSKIAFEQELPPDPFQIFIIPSNPGGGPAVSLTATDACDAHEPAWSTSGLIAFHTREVLPPDSSCLGYDVLDTIDPTTNGRTRILQDNCCDLRSPNWSPDSKKIAFETDIEGSPTESDIWVIDADGTNQVRLTNVSGQPASGQAIDPAWSPDGSKIAFTARLDSQERLELFTMDNDGSNRVQLTDDNFEPSPDDNGPDWQPVRPTVPQQVFNPVLTVNPAVVRPGFIFYATGSGFPVGATVTVSLAHGITNAKLVQVDGSGGFRVHFLIYPRDTLGIRVLTATGVTGPAFAPVSDEVLVVPGSQQPSDFVVRN